MLSNRMNMGRSRDNNRDMDMFWSRKMDMVSRSNNHRSMDMVSRGNNYRSMDMVWNSNHSWAKSTYNCRSSTCLIRPGVVGESF